MFVKAQDCKCYEMRKLNYPNPKQRIPIFFINHIPIKSITNTSYCLLYTTT